MAGRIQTATTRLTTPPCLFPPIGLLGEPSPTHSATDLAGQFGKAPPGVQKTGLLTVSRNRLGSSSKTGRG
jgi:hypothetical protein